MEYTNSFICFHTPIVVDGYAFWHLFRQTSISKNTFTPTHLHLDSRLNALLTFWFYTCLAFLRTEPPNHIALSTSAWF